MNNVPTKITAAVAGAVLLALNATTMATDAGLRLQSNSIANNANVDRLKGENESIRDHLRQEGYRVRYLQDDILQWLNTNRSDDHLVYLVVPTSPPSADWKLEMDNDAELCMRRPDDLTAAVRDQVGFLLASKTRPQWRNAGFQECAPKEDEETAQ